MAINRPQWPHTVDDIIRSLDGVWGLVGATGDNGNLHRLEKSLYEPFTYTLTEYRGNEEKEVLRKQTYAGAEKNNAIQEFAAALGLDQGAE